MPGDLQHQVEKNPNNHRDGDGPVVASFPGVIPGPPGEKKSDKEDETADQKLKNKGQCTHPQAFTEFQSVYNTGLHPSQNAHFSKIAFPKP
jgi:hypothetical protein